MKTGIVLTGGGLKGICAETGIMMAFQDIGLEYDAMIGTSAGAIVGSMLARGWTAHEAKTIFCKLKKKDICVSNLALFATHYQTTTQKIPFFAFDSQQPHDQVPRLDLLKK